MTTTSVASNNRNLCSHCSGSQKSKIELAAALCFFLRLLRRIYSLPLLVSGGCWHPLVFLGLWVVSLQCLPLSSHCLRISLYFSLMRTPVRPFRAHQGNPGLSLHLKSLNLFTSAKTLCFPISNSSRFQGLEPAISEATIQPMIHQPWVNLLRF